MGQVPCAGVQVMCDGWGSGVGRVGCRRACCTVSAKGFSPRANAVHAVVERQLVRADSGGSWRRGPGAHKGGADDPLARADAVVLGLVEPLGNRYIGLPRPTKPKTKHSKCRNHMKCKFGDAFELLIRGALRNSDMSL